MPGLDLTNPRSVNMIRDLLRPGLLPSVEQLSGHDGNPSFSLDLEVNIINGGIDLIIQTETRTKIVPLLSRKSLADNSYKERFNKDVFCAVQTFCEEMS